MNHDKAAFTICAILGIINCLLAVMINGQFIIAALTSFAFAVGAYYRVNHMRDGDDEDDYNV